MLALNLVKLWQRQHEIAVVTLDEEPSDLKAEYLAADIPVTCLQLSNAGKYSRYWNLGRAINKICRDFKPDSLLSFPFGWHSFMAYGARAAGVKSLVTHAGNYPPPPGSARRKMAFTVRLSNPLRVKVIACSSYVAEGVQRHFGVPSRDIYTIHNGIDFPSFSAPRPKAATAIRIGMVARLEIHKDQPSLIRAVKELSTKGIRVELSLVGDGSRRAEYEELIVSEGLQDQVRLLGTRRDIPKLLSSWDLFVFSAKPDEGLGIALIEALASGTPVIATDVGACREVLTANGEPLGELVAPNSPSAIAQAIEAFAVNPGRWAVRAYAAQQLLPQTFGLEAMAEKYLTVMGLA